MIQFYRGHQASTGIMPDNDLHCGHVQAQLTEYLEAPGAAHNEPIRQHLRGCAHCREVLHELQNTIALLGRLRGTPPAPPPAKYLSDKTFENH